MACYNDFYYIEVKGDKKDVAAICKAVAEFAPKSDVTKEKNVIRISDTYCVGEEEEICAFVALIARAAGGASFTLEGETEYSSGGGTMCFYAEFKNGTLTMRFSDWCEAHSAEWFDDYETYEEYCYDWDDLASEEDFKTAKESERVYIIDGKAYTEAPLGEALVIEY